MGRPDVSARGFLFSELRSFSHPAAWVALQAELSSVAGAVARRGYPIECSLAVIGGGPAEWEVEDALMQRVKELEAQWEGKSIVRPPFWGGYCVSLDVIEFWQGCDGRLHDRLLYKFDGDWSFDRLQP